MCYWLIPKSGRHIADMNLQHITSEDMSNQEIKDSVDQFEKYLRQTLDDNNFKVKEVGSD